MEWVKYVELLIGFAGLGVIYFGLRGVKMQIQATTFSDYTKRYSEIIDTLPFDARDRASKQRLDEFDQDSRQTIINTVRRYLNLCSEEMYLSDEGFIENSEIIILLLLLI